MIRRLQIFALALCLLLAQQGAILHALSHLSDKPALSVSAVDHATGKKLVGDSDNDDGICLQCLAFAAMVAAIHVVWPRIAATACRFLICTVSFASISQRAPQLYAARAPPFFS
ncbi:MAG: hypothetical protein JWM03_1925 [Rhodocyclales bacterium]|nr:hypothetical protein [Rhodocyclales bacterium]